MTTPAVLYDHVPIMANDDGVLPIRIHELTILEASSSALEDENMETILEDSSMDYVMVSIVTPQDETVISISRMILPDEDEGEGNETQWWSLLTNYAHKAARKSVEWTNGLASSASAVRGTSSAIYSSYDWVSDTMIDGGGGRLILPGPLIVMDDSPSPNTTATTMDGDPFTTGSSSTTIMVSAHDLLAMQPSSSFQENPMRTTTATTSLPKALWRITKRKTFGWIASANDTFRRSSGTIRQSVGTHLTQWERSTHAFSIASDLVSNTYDWCSPPTPRLLEEEDENEHNPQQVTIELTASTGDSTEQ